MVTDEKFFAWLDGELDAEEANRVRAEVSEDTALSAKAEQHRALQQRLATAFEMVSSARVPERLMTAARRESEVIDLAAARGLRESRGWSSLPQWAAIAATLAVGVLIGTLVPQRGNSPINVDGGKVYAAAALDQALTTQLASAPSGSTRIGLTFRDRAGAMCRSFESLGSSGLACRDGNRWQVRGLFGSPDGQSGMYRMAAGMNPNLAGLVSSTMAGDPLDASQEMAAKDKGWR